MFSEPEQRARPGFTLIEVLVTIVVLAIAATAIINVFVSTVSRSADPLIQQQATAIAEAYIEEIMSKQFCHDAPPANAPSACASETGSTEAGETNRESFNDVQDYNNGTIIVSTVQNQNGDPVGLSGYTVAVSVAAATLSGQAMMRVEVSVDHAAISPIVLAAYRANY